MAARGGWLVTPDDIPGDTSQPRQDRDTGGMHTRALRITGMERASADQHTSARSDARTTKMSPCQKCPFSKMSPSQRGAVSWRKSDDTAPPPQRGGRGHCASLGSEAHKDGLAHTRKRTRARKPGRECRRGIVAENRTLSPDTVLRVRRCVHSAARGQGCGMSSCTRACETWDSKRTNAMRLGERSRRRGRENAASLSQGFRASLALCTGKSFTCPGSIRSKLGERTVFS